MAKAALFIGGEMVRQKGLPAPKGTPTIQRWQKHLVRHFERELTTLGSKMLETVTPLKYDITPTEIRLSLPGGVAFLVDRTQDALA